MTPSPSTASLSSLVTALSEADSTARESRLLFSPKSARTNGTGATGSTEPPGEATRSLLESVQGREELLAHSDDVREEDGQRFEAPHSAAGARSRASDETDWTQLSEVRASRALAYEHARVQLPAPEPEERLFAPTSVAESTSHAEQPLVPRLLTGVVTQPVHIKLESDDGLPLDDASPHSSPASSPSRHASPATHGALTDSQEDALLAQTVTRSQSDFSHWLEETLRLARGDGSSTIESDDALSSIIEATRHAQLGWATATTRTGESRRAGSDVQSLSEGEDEPLLPDEDLTLSTIRTRETAVEGVAEDVVVEEEKEAEEDKEPEAQETEPTSQHDVPARPTSSARGWQVLSFALAAALAFSLKQQFSEPEPVPVVQLEPTRSLRYVPINETAEVSLFATPIPLGEGLPLPILALAMTLAAGAMASVPLLRRRRAHVATRPSCTSRSRSATPPHGERATSPLLELNGAGILEARRLLPIGIEQYSSCRLSEAVATFSSVVPLPCVPEDKATACEWLGRALYRLARADGNDRDKLVKAVAAFDRAIRIDGGRATPRASLGRAKFRLGDFSGATRALRAAIKRDDTLAFAHEYLAKATMRLDPRPADAAALIEQHLVRAVELDPLGAYTALACLGEFLHLCGGPTRLADARDALERAVALRPDLPAAHARLAFIAYERLDSRAAATHYAAVIATRYTGLRDPDALSASERACDGSGPFLGWTFITPRGSPERKAVLARAVLEHPHDDLLVLLHAIEASHPDASPLLPEREAILARRAQALSPAEDLAAHGLWALALLALGRDADAQRVHEVFWAEVVAARSRGVRGVEGERKVAFLAMAFYEVKRAKEDEGLGRAMAKGKGKATARASSSRKATRGVRREDGMETPVVVKVEEEDKVMPVRRSPRQRAAKAKA